MPLGPFKTGRLARGCAGCLTTGLTVTAAAGQVAPEPKNEAAAAVTPRARSGLEVGVIGIVLVLAIGLGVLFVVRAEHVGRSAQP